MNFVAICVGFSFLLFEILFSQKPTMKKQISYARTSCIVWKGSLYLYSQIFIQKAVRVKPFKIMEDNIFFSIRGLNLCAYKWSNISIKWWCCIYFKWALSEKNYLNTSISLVVAFNRLESGSLFITSYHIFVWIWFFAGFIQS